MHQLLQNYRKRKPWAIVKVPFVYQLHEQTPVSENCRTARRGMVVYWPAQEHASQTLCMQRHRLAKQRLS